MALDFVSPPPAVYDAIHTTLDSFAANAMFVTPGLHGASVGELHPADPLETYALTLMQVSTQAAVSEAQATGWQLLTRRDGRPIATADAVAYGEANWVCSEIYEGPYVIGTARALNVARHLPEVQAGSYIPRLLRLDALYLVALWLKNESVDSDLIVPIEPAPYQLDVTAGYAPDVLIGYLAGFASQILSIDTGL